MDVSTITYSNPTYTEGNVGIDVIIVHPQHGSIAFTANPNDLVQFGRDLHAKIIADGVSISPYIAPAEPEE